MNNLYAFLKKTNSIKIYIFYITIFLYSCNLSSDGSKRSKKEINQDELVSHYMSYYNKARSSLGVFQIYPYFSIRCFENTIEWRQKLDPSVMYKKPCFTEKTTFLSLSDKRIITKEIDEVKYSKYDKFYILQIQTEFLKKGQEMKIINLLEYTEYKKNGKNLTNLDIKTLNVSQKDSVFKSWGFIWK